MSNQFEIIPQAARNSGAYWHLFINLKQNLTTETTENTENTESKQKRGWVLPNHTRQMEGSLKR